MEKGAAEKGQGPDIVTMKSEAFGKRGVGQVNEDTDALAGLGFEGPAEQIGEAERREGAAGRLFLDGHKWRFLRSAVRGRCKKRAPEFGISTTAEVP